MSLGIKGGRKSSWGTVNEFQRIAVRDTFDKSIPEPSRQESVRSQYRIHRILTQELSSLGGSTFERLTNLASRLLFGWLSEMRNFDRDGNYRRLPYAVCRLLPVIISFVSGGSVLIKLVNGLRTLGAILWRHGGSSALSLSVAFVRSLPYSTETPQESNKRSSH